MTSHSYPAPQPIRPHTPLTPGVTVLLSAYHATPAEELRWCMASLAAQTRPAEHILLVLDGPVSEELRRTISQVSRTTPQLDVLELPHNRGLAHALTAALPQVRHTHIARLDTDDFAHPRRLELQYAEMLRHPELAALGTAVIEFTDATLASALSDHSTTTPTPELLVDVAAALSTLPVRAMPTGPDAVVRALRMNSPLNHPAVMLRTEALCALGGYEEVRFMEDYNLWARMAESGYAMDNMAESLTFFRTGDAQFDRRTGREMFRAEVEMQRRLRAYGLTGPARAIVNIIARSAYRALPRPLLRRVYRVLFQRRSGA